MFHRGNFNSYDFLVVQPAFENQCSCQLFFKFTFLLPRSRIFRSYFHWEFFHSTANVCKIAQFLNSNCICIEVHVPIPIPIPILIPELKTYWWCLSFPMQHQLSTNQHRFNVFEFELTFSIQYNAIETCELDFFSHSTCSRSVFDIKMNTWQNELCGQQHIFWTLLKFDHS